MVFRMFRGRRERIAIFMVLLLEAPWRRVPRKENIVSRGGSGSFVVVVAVIVSATLERRSVPSVDRFVSSEILVVARELLVSTAFILNFGIRAEETHKWFFVWFFVILLALWKIKK